MSSPSSSFAFSQSHSHSHQHRLRKGVPDASEHFQKVLYTILSDAAAEEREKHKQENQEEDEEVYYYEEDFEHDDLDESDFLGVDENSGSNNYPSRDYRHNIQYSVSFNDGKINDNNNVSKIPCELRQCKKLDRKVLTPSPIPTFGATSPSHIHIFDCDGELLYDSESPRQERERDVTFPSINQQDYHNHKTQQPKLSNSYNMGTTCSTGLYDQRDWHDIIGKDGFTDNKVRKRGKPLNRKQFNKDKYGVVSSQLCTCKCRISDSSPDPVSDPIPIPGAVVVRDNHSPPDSKSNHYYNVSSSGSPRSNISRSLSPNQGRLSRILGLKKQSSSPKGEVSPHRLLVRRSYSPKSRANSMEEMIRQNNDSIYRQRSHSWSNGKLGSKPTGKASSPTFIQSPILSPVANHNALVPSRFNSNNSPKTAAEKVKDKMLPELPRGQLVSSSAHEQTCPLFKLSQQKDKDRLSPHDPQDDVDDNITPMTRRRAVSESQTLRSRQKARRAAANAADNTQEDDHLHVHWADEGGGSSLSTSVFLSSIRPRSYSHGAECNVPHRPILKKVIIS